MRIGLIDADLIAGHRRLPNLVLMKISTYLQRRGWQTELVTDYAEVKKYYRVYLAKVFTGTAVPVGVLDAPNVVFGGTGFLYDEAVPLPDQVEHMPPDYSLYAPWATATKLTKATRSRYLDFSMGFTTRHCFRGCAFCVNKNRKRVELHSPVDEFIDHGRRYAYLLDDNLLGFPGWRQILDDLDATGKRYQYMQGLDVRLMRPETAKRLNEANYYGDFIFAFDDPQDAKEIRERLKIWRDYCRKDTKLYTLCAYKSTTAEDIDRLFYRFDILADYDCAPYVMRFNQYEKSRWRGLYIAIACWANQKHVFTKMSFREFCEAKAARYGETAPKRYMDGFAAQEPEVARRWFNWRYDRGGVAWT